jgi:hypothetical protein
MISIDKFFNGDAIVLEGCVLKQNASMLSIQLHPGLVIELQKKQLASTEQATDPITAKTLIRVTLKPDAEISAVFQPKLARLGLTVGRSGIPFNLGGTFAADIGGIAPIGSPTGGGGIAPVGSPTPTGPEIKPFQPTLKKERTWCDGGLWGWIPDDTNEYIVNDAP